MTTITQMSILLYFFSILYLLVSIKTFKSLIKGSIGKAIAILVLVFLIVCPLINTIFALVLHWNFLKQSRLQRRAKKPFSKM
jgi:hypothetical protein